MSEPKNVVEDIIAQAREMLAGDLAELEASGKELRAIGVSAIEVGAKIVVAKMNGEDTTLSEKALASALQSLKTAGSIAVAARIRATLVGLFGILTRTALSALA